MVAHSRNPRTQDAEAGDNQNKEKKKKKKELQLHCENRQFLFSCVELTLEN